MSCCKFLVKHFLFFINLIFTLIALAIVAIGSYAFHYVSTHENVLANVTQIINNEEINIPEATLRYLCIAIIMLGGVIFLISFCGCCGSITENRCLLGMYAVIMILLAGASIYVLIAIHSFFNEATRVVETQVNETFHGSESPIEDEKINAIQYAVKCCGPYGPDFYNNTDIGNIYNETNIEDIFNNTDKTIVDTILYRFNILDFIGDKLNVTGVGVVSPSCCSTFNLPAFLENQEDYILNTYECSKDDVYMEGCVPKILSYFDVVENYFTIAIMVIAGVTVVAFLLSTYLCCVIRNRRGKRRRSY